MNNVHVWIFFSMCVCMNARLESVDRQEMVPPWRTARLQVQMVTCLEKRLFNSDEGSNESFKYASQCTYVYEPCV